MSSLQPNYSSVVVEWVRNRPELASGVTLIDVGASGGISPLWNQWRPQLRAFGFDPLIREVEEMNLAETDPAVRYEAAWMGVLGPGTASPSNAVADEVRKLTSALRALGAMGVDFRSAFFNRGQAVEHTQRCTSIDEFCTARGISGVDFIKIDTDGHDFHVLKGAGETLACRGVLGLLVESMVHGPPGPDAGTFGNIDNFLRDRGFHLFDLHVSRYTRGALPGVFRYDLQANTMTGQVRWVDALYFIDPVVQPDVLKRMEAGIRDEALLKLLGLYDMFGLPDCAAQLIQWIREQGAWADRDLEDLLDRLVPANPYGLGRYQDYVAFFDQDPTRFYRSRYEEAELLAAYPKREPVAIDTLAEAALGTLSVEGQSALVRTPAARWSYAAVLYLRAARVGLIVVAVELEVLTGQVYLALADPNLAHLSKQVGLKAADGRRTLILRHESFDTLLIRNGVQDNPSSCRIYQIAMMVSESSI